jgi:hypothetical protein
MAGRAEAGNTKRMAMTRTEPRQGEMAEGFPVVIAFFLYVLVHLALIATGVAETVEQEGQDSDGFMRLLRVMQLYQSGDWFDITIPRSNAPYGEELHWTRPFDVLLLVGALVLEPIFGFERALFWSGSLAAPLLHIATAIALVWAVTPIFDRERRFFVVLTLLPQLAVWSQGTFGRIDHHMLILLVFTVILGTSLRVLLEPLRARAAILAGAAAGLGLWLSVAFLVILAAVFGALVVRWLREGEAAARRNAWHAVGLVAVIAVAMLLERPAGERLAEEYDRISVVHLSVGLIAVAFWVAVLRLERRNLSARVPGGRLGVAVLGTLAAGGVVLLVFPKFFLGPEVDYDPRLRPIFLDLVIETQPLIPTDRSSLGWLLVYLGPAAFVLPYLAMRLWRDRNSEAWCGLVFLTFALVPYFFLALNMRRFSTFAEILLAIVMADVLAGLFARIGREPQMVRRVAIRVLVIPLVLFGGIFAGGVLIRPNGAGASTSCEVRVLTAELNRPEGLGRESLKVLFQVSQGPELMYRTRHSVVSTPYPRNAEGQIDAYHILSATDLADARRLVEARGLDLITVCIHRPAYFQLSADPDTLDSRLRAGEPPVWLEAVSLSGAAAEQFRIYRVVPSAL